MDHASSQLQPFPTTQWSLLQLAGGEDPEKRQRALAEICQLYWPPVYSFIRSRGHSEHDAQDLTQGLFEELLKRNDFAKADHHHGRLRSYLRTAAKNHLASDYRHQHQLKRGGNATIQSIDTSDAEARCLTPELVDTLTPDRVFDRQWAITLMENVIQKLRQRYEEMGKSDLFDALRPCILTTLPPNTQTGLAGRLGLSEQALRVAIHRLRQRYAVVLRQVVKSTLVPGQDVDEELAFLMETFH